MSWERANWQAWGELLRREGYTGGHGATSVHEKENGEAHGLEGKREGGV